MTVNTVSKEDPDLLKVCTDITDKTYSLFCDDLRDLISMRSCFLEPKALEASMKRVSALFQKYLPTWSVCRDARGNLRVLPPNNTTKTGDLLYLCAHLDTVGANPEQWQKGNPFTCIETREYLTGRGANDCKAGVAFMLYVAQLIQLNHIPEHISLNLGGFLVTLREEGAGSSQRQIAGPKTARCFAEDFVSNILPSSERTFVCCLENTVTIDTIGSGALEGADITIGIYDCEPCTLHIKTKGTIKELRALLLHLKDWKPVVIYPDGLETIQKEINRKEMLQEGGHSCSVENKDNLIHKLILSNEYDQHYLLWNGQADTTTKINRSVYVTKITKEFEVDTYSTCTINDELRNKLIDCKNINEPQHILHLNYRGFKTKEVIHKELKQLDNLKVSSEHSIQTYKIPYSWTFGFPEGAGCNQRHYLHENKSKSKLLEQFGNNKNTTATSAIVRSKFEPNPGRSDSSQIWNNLSSSLRGYIPFTCGPGHRSHRCKETSQYMRKTHGVNEGFHKPTGKIIMPYFLRFIMRFIDDKTH